MLDTKSGGRWWNLDWYVLFRSQYLVNYSNLILPTVLLDMRRDVQEIFRLTPHEKQCMMFSATLSKEIRPVCRKFMQDVSPKTFHFILPLD